MSTPQAPAAPLAPHITTISPAGHTVAAQDLPPAQATNTPAQPPAAATTARAPNAPIMAAPSTAPAQHILDEPTTYNEKLNAADRLWKFKLALTIILILTGLIGIGCLAWAVSTANGFRAAWDYGYDDTWSLPWGLITFSISVLWCSLCVVLFLARKRAVEPGLRVAIDLILWLAFIVTVLCTLNSFFSLLQWGEYGSLSGYSSSRYGDYKLADNGTWVFVQDSEYSVTYPRSCNSTTSSSSYSTSYITDHPFKDCAEMDAYVNQLWQAKPNRARTELCAVVCQFIGLILHFALFVWACVDCHHHRRSKVSKDAEKIAAGIVEKMLQSGSVVRPPGQAHVTGQPMYYSLPDQPHGQQGQGYSIQQQPMYVQQFPGQQTTAQHQHHYQQHQHQQQQQQPVAGSSTEKGVASSYYEPGR